MPRVPAVDLATLAPEVRERVERNPINLYRTLAHLGEGFLRFSDLGQWIRHRSLIDGRLREMAILAVGLAADSGYEVSHHIKIGMEFGLSEADVAGIVAYCAGAPSELAAADRLIVRAALEVAVDGAVVAVTWDELVATYPLEIAMELTLVCAFYCAVTRMLRTFEVEVETPYRGYLARFGLEGLE